MPRRSVFVRSLLVVAGAAVVAPAQGAAAPAPRRPTFARVEDHLGRPLADAVVAFVGGVPHVGIGVGPRDVLQVQSDARGRAQARLQPGLCYVAWAAGPADAEGARAVSPVSAWFGAESLITLRCGPPVPPRALVVDGIAAWQAKGPLRFVAWTPMPGLDAPLALGSGNRLELPAGPFDTVEVQTADGVPLWHWSFTSSVLVVPPPRQVRVRAKDESGAPLAGASVRLRVGRLPPWRNDSLGSVVEERWRPLGVTAADGSCEVEVPYAADPLREQGHGDLLMFVGAPGRPSVAGGVMQRELYVDDRKAPKGPLDELVFTCKRVEPLAGSVGRVPAGTVVHLAAVCKMFLERTSYRHDTRSFTAAVQPDGSFRFDDVPAELHSCRLSLVSPAGALPNWPVFPSQLGRTLPPEATGSALGVLQGDTLADMTLRVLEPSGGPARGLVAFLTPASAVGVLVRDSTIRFPLDARGMATMRLTPGPWVVTAWTETGWGARRLDIKPGVVDEVLALQPPLHLRLQLLAADGKPIAGARVVQRGTTTRGTGDPLQSTLQGMRAQWMLGWGDLRTDADGRVAIPFIPVDGVTQRLGLQWDAGSTADVMLEAGEDWVPVRPR